MNSLNENLPYGVTPLDLNEITGLIPKHIVYLTELNELEQNNISRAILWLEKSRKKDFLTVSFVMKIHKHMFNHVWEWAGKFRNSNKNIGCDWTVVSSEVKKLLDNVHYWLNHKTYEIDEIGVRLHHKLVFIHPFANGNGRHARLYTDVFMKLHKAPPFTWGQVTKNKQTVRKDYIDALRAADQKDLSKLLKCVRS